MAFNRIRSKERALSIRLTMPNAKETHTVQYFEMFGNRAIYSDGWFARTIHRPAWMRKGLQELAGRSVGALQHK